MNGLASDYHFSATNAEDIVLFYSISEDIMRISLGFGSHFGGSHNVQKYMKILMKSTKIT